jgi:hypothetical protein
MEVSMSKSKAIAAVAVGLALGTVPSEAGTTKHASVSGVTRGSTVSVEATVQCPQGQPQCNAPQDPAGTLSLSWPDSRAEFQIQQLSPEAKKAASWVLKGSIEIDRDLPEGKTAGGDFALVLNENYAIDGLKITVRR